MTGASTRASSIGVGAQGDRSISGPALIPSGVGSRFYADGRVRRFPGNTVIFHLPKGPVHDGLLGVFQQLNGLSYAAAFALLPPSSWHMTLFEGVCDEVRTDGHWPADLPRDAPLEASTALFASRLESFTTEAQPPFRVQITGLEPMLGGIGLTMAPVDMAENLRLRQLRDRLSKTLGLRHAAHDTYRFHISLGYLMRYLTADEVREVTAIILSSVARLPTIEFGAPEFCVFDDMFHFERQFYLAEASGKAGQ